MSTCKCGKEVASNARVCPHCGKRFTSNITAALAFLFAVAIIGALVNAASTPKTAPVAPKTVQQIEDDDYGAAIYVCEQWTEKNSKVAVDEFIHEYRLPRKKNSKNFAVRIEYRTKGAGWPMQTRCEVSRNVSGNYVLLSAKNKLND